MSRILEITREQGICIIAIPQRFDAGNAPDAERELRSFLTPPQPEKMILDFSQTDYIASAGLKVILLVTRDVMKAGGRVVLAGLRQPVMKIFEMAGFTSIFSISGSREDAIRKLS